MSKEPRAICDVFVGNATEERERARVVDVNKHARRHHPYHHQLTVRHHDWLLTTDPDHLMQLLGQGSIRDRPPCWPPTPLTQPEVSRPVTSSASVDWPGRRRRLPSPRRSANEDAEAHRRTTHADVLSTSELQLPSIGDSTATTRSSPVVEQRQPFPVYPPLLGGVFPATSSTSSSPLLSSSLAYEMLATAALSSLRHALPFASLLPPSSTSYDVISAAAAAAALLQPRSHHFGAFAAPHVTGSSLVQPEVDHGDRGSVLDLVVAQSRSEPTMADGPSAADVTGKYSPCRRDADCDPLSAVVPKPRACVWRPY